MAAHEAHAANHPGFAQASAAPLRKRVEVRGIVQGVGFRPWVYRLAQAHRLGGFVLNSSSGVTVELEGSPDSIQRFLADFAAHPPELARIDELRQSDIAPRGESEFVICESVAAGDEFALAPPDIATCADCYADFTDPANRRYQYPFTNCTNCGPRYTILRDIPYDRPFTTMDEFRMCLACQAEYDDPANRRFHAQPNACPVCGPRLDAPDALARTRRDLAEGRIVAIKGLGGFHLACDAANDAAVRRLRERKRGSGKPFALMARDLEAAEKLADLTEEDRHALLGPRRPIVIVSRRKGAEISSAVAPGNPTIGVMLPYTPLHHLLFAGPESFLALVMTSGNFREEPIVSVNEEAPRLKPLCDSFLLHNRRIQTRVDDSVVRCFEGRERVLRRSRGYAPHPIDLGVSLPPVLAVGGELKNTFCLTKNHYAIPSQHIGDLENYETRVFFEETLAHMQRFFRVEPEIVAHDLHPGYLSTRMAQAMRGVEKIGVQHHHAHIASCMAEHHLREKVIGVAMDGTGYGTDGRIWGGEFLVCDYSGFERRAHLRYVPLPGGDAAIREPWRMGQSYLIDTFGSRAPRIEGVAEAPQRTVAQMIAKKINTVDTSSCGRLFDAVASILGVRQEVTYEGQAAIELEAIAAEAIEDSYPFLVEREEIDVRPMIEAMLRDRTEPALASARFHNTVAEMIAKVCGRLRASEGLNRVCLSGGTFQNFTLLKRALALLRRAGFEVLLHARIPPNDGGISIGQAVIAGHILRTRPQKARSENGQSASAGSGIIEA